MVSFNLARMLWPFLWEMFFGKRKLMDAARNNTKRFIFLGVVVLSFIFNLFAIPKLIMLSNDYLELQKHYKDYQQDVKTHYAPPARVQYYDTRVKQLDDEVVACRFELHHRYIPTPTPIPIPRGRPKANTVTPAPNPAPDAQYDAEHASDLMDHWSSLKNRTRGH